MPRTSTQVSVTGASGLKSAGKPAAASRGNVKPSLTSHGNAKKLSGSRNGCQRSILTHDNTDASKPASRPLMAQTANRPLTSSKSTDHQQTSSKSASGSQYVAAGRKSSQCQGGPMLNRRRSHTSQFRSVSNQCHAAQPPAAVTQWRSAAERRKSYHSQLLAKQKTTAQSSNQQSRTDHSKSSHLQLNSKKKADEGLQSCHDCRKSYHAKLLGRRRSVLAASKKPAPRQSDRGQIETSVSKAMAENPRISTPFSSRRTKATTTPSLSCIPRRKTVSFLTPSASRKATPRLHRTQPVSKEMSMR